jgi:hypothetical protein
MGRLIRPVDMGPIRRPQIGLNFLGVDTEVTTVLF